jgi:hypothetical protein
MNRSTRLALVSALLLASACSDENDPTDGPDPTPATREDYDDMAQAVGKLVVAGGLDGGETASFSDSVTIALGTMPIGFSLTAEGEIDGSRGGLAYSYSIACSDAEGNSLESCGSTTDSAAISVAWSGALDLPNFQAMIERNGDWTVTGLQGDTATFEGASDFDFSVQFQSLFRPVTRAYHLTYDAAYDAVLVDTETRTAIGGSIHYGIDAQRTVTGDGEQVEARFVIDADVSFAADGAISLTLDGTEHYTIDATGNVVRV